MLLLLPTLVLANTVWQMALALLAFGAALGSLDVAMNVHAVEVERGTGRPLMSGFHALFSVGGFMGSALMTLLLALAVSPLLGTLLCSTLMAAAMLPTRSRLLVTPRSTTHGVSMVLPRGPVLLLSLLAAVTFLVEGALLDWSALLLTETGLALAEHAGLGYAVFAAAMTAGRFSGDAASARFGDRALMFWGGVVAVAGFVLVLLPRSLPLTLPGFALVGLGASNIVPVLFRKAGSQSAMPAAVAVSAITTIGYAGYLLGPAALGYISKLAGVAAAFWLLAGLMGLVPIFARQATGAATTVADPAP